jgi:4-carboxymuconolactone decarboxylase
MSDERFDRGWDKITEINEPYAYLMRESMKGDAAPLFRYSIEFIFGDILSRTELDIKSREIATVAALTVLGSAQPQLRFHIHGALNVGWTREEVTEIILQMAVYAGFPAALNGMSVAREVFAERDAQGLN